MSQATVHRRGSHHGDVTASPGPDGFSRRDGPSYLDELARVGRAAGLDAVGAASAEPFVEALGSIEERKRAGLHAGMQFTYRNPNRSADPRRTLPSARSLVVAARSYPAGEPEPSISGRGRVAWCATDDHYGALRVGLHAIASRLCSDRWKAVVLADDNALVDRAAAHRAGLGWFGKNANILLPDRGSWFLLGSVLTDAELHDTSAAGHPVPDGCGACRRCVDGCPTNAIVAPGVVDARRCLAWSLQAEGTFPVDQREALRDRLYGCDDCQLVCPVNRRGSGTSPDAPSSSARRMASVDLVDLLEATDEQLLETYGLWYIARRDPRYLRRNALVALGNTGDARDPGVVRAIRRCLDGGDAMLAEHAVWAAGRLGLSALLDERGAARSRASMTVPPAAQPGVQP